MTKINSRGKNKKPIYAHHYDLQVGSEIYRGVSYSEENRLKAGDSVPVEYVVGNPSESSIVGFNANEQPAIVLFFFLVPLLGAGMAVMGVVRGRKRTRLLQYGELAIGTFVRKQTTIFQVNGSRVSHYFFRFTDSSGVEHQVKNTTYREDVFEGKENRKTELLYDPASPQDAMLLKALPRGIGIIGDEIHVASAALLYLLLPAVAVLANVALPLILLR